MRSACAHKLEEMGQFSRVWHSHQMILIQCFCSVAEALYCKDFECAVLIKFTLLAQRAHKRRRGGREQAGDGGKEGQPKGRIKFWTEICKWVRARIGGHARGRGGSPAGRLRAAEGCHRLGVHDAAPRRARQGDSLQSEFCTESSQLIHSRQQRLGLNAGRPTQVTEQRVH